MTNDEKLKFIEEALEKGMKAMGEMVIVIRDLTDCLEDMTNHYTELAKSGDCGHWKPEEESEVIGAWRMIEEVRQSLNSLPADGSKGALE